MTLSAHRKVSIVIPVYNGSDYLAYAIESALGQSYPALEIIVVNDGSTDGGATENVASAYGDRIRYFAKPNGHVASALNFGIRQMTGDFFSWLSHDDLYKPDKIERQMRALERLGMRTVVYSDFELLEEASGMVTPVTLSPVPPEHFRYHLTLNNSLHGCTLLIPKQCLDESGPFDESLRTTQDYNMWFRLARCCRFVHVPGIVVTSRQHDQQGSIALRDVAVIECDRLLEGFVRELAASELTSATGRPVERAYLEMAGNLHSRGFLAARDTALALSRRSVRNQSLLRRLWLALETIFTIHGQWFRARLGRGYRFFRSVVHAIREFVAPRRISKHFTDIYKRNTFGGRESRSGEGSTLEQTAAIRREIPRIVEELGAKSLLDAPCGDFNWMKEVELGVEKYYGVDIVEDLIAHNNARFANPAREFLRRDLIREILPAADIVLCRDCLVHLNFKDAKKVLQNFHRSGCTYLLTTTFTKRDRNADLRGDDIWRTLNLELPPFNFPSPLMVIDEECTEGGGAYADKCLGLWRLSDLDLQ